MKAEVKHVEVVPAPLIFLALLVVGLMLNRDIPIRFLPSSLAHVAGIVAAAGSLLVGGSAVISMRRAHTSPNPRTPTRALVETGMFRYTRNPLYLSLLGLYTGIAVYANDLWPILLIPLLVVLVEGWVVKPEETYLEQSFGDAYTSYKRRVRRWI